MKTKTNPSPARNGGVKASPSPAGNGGVRLPSKVEIMPQPGGALAPRMREMLEALGEDPTREGLLRTPERYERAMRFLTSGYTANLEEIVNNAVFHVACDEMVIVKDIEFFSMC